MDDTAGRATGGPRHRRRAASAWVAALAAVLLTSCAAEGSSPAPVPSDPATASARATTPATPGTATVLVYRGPAGCDGCSEAAAGWIAQALPGARTAFVGPAEVRPVDEATLADAVLYVQPGGDGSVASASAALSDAEERAITSYVRAGGRYLGICQGAYLAGHSPGMGLLGGADTGQYIALPDAAVRTTADALVAVVLDGTKVAAFFQDGPYVVPDASTTVVARYADGRVDAATTRYGRGVVGVVGTHPEAPARWYLEAGLDDAGRPGNAAVGVALLTAMGLDTTPA